MLVTVTGTGGTSGGRVSGPTSTEIFQALQECASITGRSVNGSATQMLLADIARCFNAIRILSTTEVSGDWHTDALVNVQSRGNAPVSLKVQFHLQQQDATWIISAARLLQS